MRFSMLFVLLAAVCASAAFPQTPDAAPVRVPAGEEQYRIGYRDVIDIQVFRHPELNARVTPNPDGTIVIPRATKPIDAYCKTERELKAIIEEDYRSFLNKPFVTVSVAEQRSQSFGVIGAVEKPGNYFVNRRVPLLELLSFAGGPNKEAGSRMIVARLGSNTACRQNLESEFVAGQFFTFRIRDVQEGRMNMLAQAGDIVSVLDSDFVFVYGSVNKQGEVPVNEPRTLRQIIASAEGFAPAARRDKIRVFRQRAGSAEWEEFTYNFKEIESGRVNDPFLLPNDIVAVSEDGFRKVLSDVTKGLTGGLGNLPIFVK